MNLNATKYEAGVGKTWVGMGFDNEPPAPELPAGPMEGELLAARYRVGRVLGAGGMGIVRDAFDVSLRKRVAVKTLRPELWGNVDVRERFAREAKFAARLRGEHSVRVFASGRAESGLPFLVMERLEGMDLAELVRRCSPIAVTVAVDYLMQACAGLSEAHGAGLVHRDVKPGNLFLALNGGGAACVRLLDFGIAEPLKEPISHSRGCGELLGSPAYVAPEQLEAPCPADVRADIWSLGVVAFELLTGRSPFQRSSTTDTCWSVLLEPVPDLRELRPDVDAGLEAIVRRCLQRSPARRFASARELRDALRPFAAGRSSPAVAAAAGGPRPRRRRAPQPTAVGLSDSAFVHVRKLSSPVSSSFAT